MSHLMVSALGPAAAAVVICAVVIVNADADDAIHGSVL